MPKVSDFFGPIYQNVTLDGSGNGSVSFQAVGSAARITNIFFRVATTTAQAVCTVYRGQVAVGNIIFNSNSGSTGGNAKGNVDLFDGDTVFVRWTGGDPGAVATATFTGQRIPFQDMRASELTFDDPIAAGDGSLIFPAIKSPNFATGVSGWKIDRLGNAEFNNATIRGTFIAGDVVIDSNGVTITGSQQIVYIKDTGLEITENPDTGGFVFLASAANFGGIIQLEPIDSTVGGITFDIGFIVAARDDTGGTASRPYLSIRSPIVTGKSPGRIFVRGQKSDATTDDSYIEITSGRGLYFSKYNTDSGCGRVTSVGSGSSSAPIGATETVILTLPNTTYKAGRAYQAVISLHVATSVANNTPICRVRKTNTAGLQLGFSNTATVNTGQTNGSFTCEFWVDTADVTAVLILSLTGSGAYNATAVAPFAMHVFDIGDSSVVSGYAVELT